MSALIPALFLSLFGLLNLFGLNHDLFLRQLIAFVMAVSVFFVIRRIGRRLFLVNSGFFYWLMAGVLIITYIIGVEVKGSKRWLDLYFFNFQASEFFKVFMILHLSKYLSQKKLFENNLIFFMKGFLMVAVPGFIIFKQPDLGNAVVYGFFYLLMVLFVPKAKEHLFHLAAVLALLTPPGWFFLKNYQKARILSFINPHLDTQGTSYNMIQAVITIGSGGFFGKGLGLSTQSRLYFLPENTTDFAFASLIEQFGFFGGTIVMFLYFVLIYQLFIKIVKYLKRTDPDSRQKYLYTTGILSYLVFQIFVNIGMNMGLLPIAGIALPFISYGGSAIMTAIIGLALLP